MPESSILIHCGRFRDLTAAVATRIRESRSQPSPELAEIANPIRLLIPSRGLAEVIAERVADDGPRAFTGVEFLTLDDLAGRILNDAGSYPRIATDAERRIAMDAAVRAIGDPKLAGAGIPSILHRAYRDVRDGGLTLAELRRHARGASSPHLASILRIWSAYDANVARIGAIDPADRLTLAARQIEHSDAIHPLVLFGFYDATGAQKDLIASLWRRAAIDAAWVPVECRDGEISEEVRFGAALLQFLRDLGGRIIPIDAEPRPPDVAIRRFATRRHELREIARDVGARIAAGTRPGRIAIVARSIDPEDAAVMQSLARELGFPILPRAGIPARAHRIHRGLRALLALREQNFPRRDVIDLLHCGLAKRPLAIDPDAIDRIDRATRNARIAGGSGALLAHAIAMAIEDAPAAERALRHFKEIVATLETVAPDVDAARSPARWADLLDDLRGRFRLETRADLAADDAIASVSQLLRRIDSMGITIAVEAVRAHLDDLDDLVADASGEAVWYGDVMMFRGRSADVLFAYGVEEEIFPQGRAPDPILDDSTRRRLGVHEIGDGVDEESFLFRLLLDATDDLHLSFATTDRMGKASRPSRLLRRLAVARDPESETDIAADFAEYLARRPVATMQFASARERRIESIRAPHADATPISARLARMLRLASTMRTRSAFDGYLSHDDELRAAIAARLGVISPTRLEDYGECPQRFLMRHLFGVEEYEDPEREVEIELRKKGTLQHRILEELYATLDDDEIVASGAARELGRALAERLQETTRRILDEYDAKHPPFVPAIREIERGSIARTIREFVLADLAELHESGFRPREFERRFGIEGNEPVELTIAGVTMRLRGVIDRVDRNPWRNVLRIVDYKSGSGSRFDGLANLAEHGRALQLPLYALASMQIWNLPPERIEAMVKPLLARARPHRFSFSLGENLDRLRGTLDTIVGSALDGAFPAWTDNQEVPCRYCPVRHACRTRHDPDERAALQSYRYALDLLSEGTAPP